MTGPASWTDPAWLDDVRRWALRQLAALGAEPTGPITQPHVRTWATTLRIPTTAGVFWCKANGPAQAFEGRLLQVLHRLAPDEVAEPVAVDHDRHLVLLPDAGERLRERVPGLPQLEVWRDLLPRYAELQLAVAPHVDALLDAGTPDLRPARLPGLLRELADERVTLCESGEEQLGAAEHAELLRRLPEFERLCDEVAALGVPDAVQHDDLHDGNVFVRDGRARAIDWGDACVSQPFHTLVVTLRALAHALDLPPGDGRLLALRDAYLEPFAAYGTPRELRAAVELTRGTGAVQRALAWWALVRAAPPVDAADFADSVPYGVRRWLRDDPYGAWR
ncbi:aminoglycoside phosphotransferase family protein [Angustibacter aerolatus]